MNENGLKVMEIYGKGWNGWKSWEWLEWLRIAGNSWKWPKQLEIAETAGNGWKYLEMDQKCQQTVMTRMMKITMMMVKDQERWHYQSLD